MVNGDLSLITKYVRILSTIAPSFSSLTRGGVWYLPGVIAAASLCETTCYLCLPVRRGGFLNVSGVCYEFRVQYPISISVNIRCPIVDLPVVA